MASVRKLKKEINNMVFDVVEECYSIQLFNPSKKEKTDKFIDEAADFMNEMMTKINSATSKKEYNAIVSEAETTAEKWIERLNKLQG